MTLRTLDLGLPGRALRAWRETDAEALARHANNPAVWRNMSDGFPHPYTLEVARHWVRQCHVDFGGDNWAIAFDDEAVGGCGMHPEAGPFRRFRARGPAGRRVGRHTAAGYTDTLSPAAKEVT